MRRLVLTLFLAAAVGCGGKVIVQPTPTDQAANVLRTNAKRASDATRAVLVIVREAAVIVNELPVSVEVKDGLDCAILRVTGTTVAPSARVQQVCGSVPMGPGPLDRALIELEAVTSEPSLCATLGRLRAPIDALLTRFDQASQAALRMAATAIRATMAVLGSIPCGSTEAVTHG